MDLIIHKTTFDKPCVTKYPSLSSMIKKDGINLNRSNAPEHDLNLNVVAPNGEMWK